MKTDLSAADLITQWAARGRYHFTTDEATRAIGGSAVAVRASLRRLKQKGSIATPMRGFHVIVPPEYQRLGSLPAEQFVPQMMAALEVPYYCGLLSAAQIHGAAHHAPQVFQVMVARNRPRIVCGSVRVAFIARQNAASIPVIEQNTPRGTLRVSSAEATAFDLVGYPHHAGGWDLVATILGELAELISADRLAAVAPLSPISWAQRLGHLLELSGAGNGTDALAEMVAKQAREFVPLDPSSPVRARTRRDPRWKLFVNVRVTAES